MRLTQHTDYGLRVLVYLALRSGELSTIREISESYNISRNHLMKVVQKLGAAGYVESIRGQGGGLRLDRPAAEINIGKLVSDLEPDFGMVECKRTDNQCVITSACLLPGIFDHALKAFMETLEGYTLEDLLPPANKVKNFRASRHPHCGVVTPTGRERRDLAWHPVSTVLDRLGV